MALRPVFRTSAKGDLENIENWIAERSPAGARNVLADIMRAVEVLCDQPAMGRSVPERPYRAWVTKRYRYYIVYQIMDDALEVRAIYHPRQNRPY